MIVVGYRNGFKKDERDDPLKGSYGLKVSAEDRDKHFKRKWGTIILTLEGENQPFEVNVDKDSFWIGNCRELLHKNIKDWFFKNKIIPWEKGNPPKIELSKIKDNEFRAKLPS